MELWCPSYAICVVRTRPIKSNRDEKYNNTNAITVYIEDIYTPSKEISTGNSL